MKKGLLAVITLSFLLGNFTFTSTHTKNAKDSTVSSVMQNNRYCMSTYDAQ